MSTKKEVDCLNQCTIAFPQFIPLGKNEICYVFCPLYFPYQLPIQEGEQLTNCFLRYVGSYKGFLIRFIHLNSDAACFLPHCCAVVGGHGSLQDDGSMLTPPDLGEIRSTVALWL